jgi:glycosyltransferase involved in cell wall biosynthesis
MKQDKTGSGVVLYDHLLVAGGAERVTLTAAANLRADLVCDFADARHFPAEVFAATRLIELGRPLGFPPWRLLQGMRHFRRRASFIKRYDWAFFSGVAAPLAVYHHPSAANLYYCHTIPRFAYDLKEYYAQSAPPWQRPALAALAAYVRWHYRAALRRMDLLVANSRNVQDRIKRYLGMSAEVIHPPCDVDQCHWLGQGDYYLSTARLEPYKRIDVIIEAFRRLPEKRLLIASGGSQAAYLRRISQDAPNISFLGWLDDAALRRVLGHALATIYVPLDEDFGISPVESMAAGKPVIGVAEGGLLETVRDGVTGSLVPAGCALPALVEAIRAMSPARARAMRAACERRAELFSRGRFLDRIRQCIHGLDR